MKGDFSRSTFDHSKHYRSVRMQQGRVQLDADWNENLDGLLHRIETETQDVIGECGVPVHHAAFGVASALAELPLADQDAAKKLFPLKTGDFLLTRGRAYVDGLLVEADEASTYLTQPYHPAAELPASGVYALYLDVWERLITALEDPAIRETALGGPDTAVRGKLIWQALLAQVGKSAAENISCINVTDPWPGPSTGQLCARTTPSPEPDDPCTVAPGAGYKRLENQLYRVEIHSAEPGKETFKWSRENGSIVVAITALNIDGSADKLQVASLGRDEVLGLHELDFVEVSDEAHELAGLPGQMAKILQIDPDDNVITLDQAVSGFNAATAKLRRWESGEVQVAVPATNDGYLPLEDGVEIKFQLGIFHSGDYWQIPARTVPGKFGVIEWPLDDSSQPLCQLPFGIQHHFCKLAIITFADGVIVDVQDCRKKFPPLTELPGGGNCCCSVSVGPDGDYPDLQAAVDARPADAQAWQICLEAGIHLLQKTVLVEGAVNLVISGCELQTRLVAPNGEPAILFKGGSQLTMEGFNLQANSPLGALVFERASEIRIIHITTANGLGGGLLSRGDAVAGEGNPGPIVTAIACANVDILENIFSRGFSSGPALKIQARRLTIRENRLQGGGIQVLPGSSLVEITDNFLFKGMGPGIQLGGLTSGDVQHVFSAGNAVYYENSAALNANQAPRASVLSINVVRISGNLILAMQGSGIITKNQLNGALDFGDLENVVITDNRISGCGSQADLDVLGVMQVGGGVILTGVFNAEISNNTISENGGGNAACGIYLLEGSNIQVSNNLILENGSGTNDPETKLYQAGIGGHFLAAASRTGVLFGNLIAAGAPQDAQAPLAKTGIPALRVQGNEVVCPAGPAFSILAVGGLVVEGNTFSTREIRKAPGVFGKLERGSCVNILDTGIPAWYGDMVAIFLATLAGKLELHFDGQALQSTWTSYPDGRVLFSGNQVNFRSATEESIDPAAKYNLAQLLAAATMSTYIFTLDDAGIQDNQFQAIVPDYILQGLKLLQQKKIDTPVWLAYLFKFIHVYAAGPSLRATGNAISEGLYSNFLSYGSNALLMNLSTNNQVTHALLTSSGNPSKNLAANNQSLLLP